MKTSSASRFSDILAGKPVAPIKTVSPTLNVENLKRRVALTKDTAQVDYSKVTPEKIADFDRLDRCGAAGC